MDDLNEEMDTIIKSDDQDLINGFLNQLLINIVPLTCVAHSLKWHVLYLIILLLSISFNLLRLVRNRSSIIHIYVSLF